MEHKTYESYTTYKEVKQNGYSFKNIKAFEFNYGNDHYSIKDNENKTISIEKNGIVKTYKVKEYYGFTYAIRKTFIGCVNINDLINHFKECIENDFAVKVWCIDPINRLLEITKPISNL